MPTLHEKISLSLFRFFSFVSTAGATFDLSTSGQKEEGPYFSDWNPDFTDWAGIYWTIYGMEKCTCHGIVNALDYIKDENNDLLEILFNHLVFI